MIPGHFKAFTVWFLIIMCVCVYLVSSSWYSVLGLSLIIIGGFMGDQSTHLAQIVHKDMPNTSFERWQQKHRYISTILGIAISIAGCIILLK